MKRDKDGYAIGVHGENEESKIDRGLFEKLQDFLVQESRRHVVVYNGENDEEDVEDEVDEIAPERELMEHEGDIMQPDDHHGHSPDGEMPATGYSQQKRMYFRKKNYFPVYRIVKTDIRRQYFVMLMNVMNSQQLNLVHSFFCTYAIPSLVCKYNISSTTKIIPKFPNLRGNFQTNSRLATVLLVFGLGKLSPDYVVRANNTIIRTWNQGERCELESDYFVEGSVLFDIPLKNLANASNEASNLLPHCSSPTPSSCSCPTSSSTSSFSPSSSSFPTNASYSHPSSNHYSQKMPEDLENHFEDLHLLPSKKLYRSPIKVKLFARLMAKINETRMIEELFIF